MVKGCKKEGMEEAKDIREVGESISLVEENLKFHQAAYQFLKQQKKVIMSEDKKGLVTKSWSQKTIGDHPCHQATICYHVRSNSFG